MYMYLTFLSKVGDSKVEKSVFWYYFGLFYEDTDKRRKFFYLKLVLLNFYIFICIHCSFVVPLISRVLQMLIAVAFALDRWQTQRHARVGKSPEVDRYMDLACIDVSKRNTNDPSIDANNNVQA